jgi:ribosomal protein L29
MAEEQEENRHLPDVSAEEMREMSVEGLEDLRDSLEGAVLKIRAQIGMNKVTKERDAIWRARADVALGHRRREYNLALNILAEKKRERRAEAAKDHQDDQFRVLCRVLRATYGEDALRDLLAEVRHLREGA